MADRVVTVRLHARVQGYVDDIAKAAAATKYLRLEAERVDGSRYRAHLDLDTKSAEAGMKRMQGQMGGLKSRQISIGTGNLNRQTREIRVLGSAIAALGPAGVAAGAVAGAGLLGLAGTVGVVAAAAGTGIAAFQGVGDALEALRAYELDPTAANLEKLREAQRNLTVEGQRFTRYLHSLRGPLRELRNTAQAGLLPGAESGLKSIMTLLPQVEQLVGTTARTMGDLAAEQGRTFDSAGAREYVQYLDGRARPVLDALVRSTMDVGRGVLGMARGFDVAFGDDVLAGARGLSREFAQWGQGLRFSSDVQSFGDYVREVGPQVGATLGAISRAILAVAEAAAPMSGPVLGAIRGIATAVEMVADSGAGPVIFGVAAALGALNLSLKAMSAMKPTAVIGLLDGLASKGGAASGAAGRLAGMLRGLGPAVVVGAAALAGIMWSYDQVRSKAMESAEAVVRGTMTTTAAFDSELRRLRDRKAVMQGMTEGAAMGQAIGELTGKIDANAQALAEETEAWRLVEEGRREYLAGLSAAEAAVARQVFAQDDLNRAVREFGANSPQAIAAQRDLNTAARDADVQQRAAALGVDTHTASVSRQRDLFLGAIDTQLSWHRALQTATQSIKDNGANVDINTAAGLRNREALQGMARAALDDVRAKGEHGASTREITDLTNRHRDQLYRTALQMGMSKDEANKYIRELGLTPEQVTTEFKTPGLADAVSKSAELKRNIEQLVNVRTPSANMAENWAGRASGGPIVGPGTGTSDSVPIMGSNGEWVIRERVSREQGSGAMAALNAGYADIVPRYATGGQIGGTRHHVIEKDFQPTAKGLQSALDRLFPPMPAGMVGAAAGGWGGGVQRWAPLALQALAMMGQPASYLGITLRRMNQESGGNPTIVNTWDSNARRGTPSVGLMQTIGPTYRAYADPRRNLGMTDPLSNILASMRYALARYGSLPAAYNKAGGYDRGGIASGIGYMPKYTIAPERVLSPRQTESFDRLVSVLDRPTPITSIAGAVRGGDGASSSVTINNENHFRETVDIDLFEQRMDFAVRRARL
ncbi:hypothetical protein GCM10009613_11610 [Pseudonocardia kongjuensis]|uniref:Transglycosylase SLT domain-containing protein n=1 Tax=Pseudonocardia kongjuensis TaxID=102227 RepID=A0ABN1XKH0_9PSEU